MCGICGFCITDGKGAAASRETLEEMSRAIQNRGPDGEGFFHRDYPAAGNGPGLTAGLAHRRLAIIDLATGSQPISNEDGTVFLAANAEIYNAPELRSELEGKGHAFRTKTDVEVLIHLYEEEGPDSVGRLNGMFAFAIWDGKRRRLLLARDRFGIKPLHVFLLPRGIVFASEIKSLLCHPLVKPVLNLESLDRYLTLEYVPSPHTIFEGIEKLPAAHRLVWENGEVEKQRYWSLSPGVPDEVSEAEAVGEIQARLREAVTRRLAADVPVGVFLSGGIDSSLVTALAAGSGSDAIQTFSIAFEDPTFDESKHARRVADEIGSRHFQKTFTPADMLEIVPRLYDFLDEPFADASVIPTALLSRFTRGHVKVALGGDGGDELFAGYPTYMAHRLAAFAERLPAVVREKLLPSIVKRLPTSLSNISLDFKAKRFVRGLPYSPVARNAAWLGAFTDQERDALYSSAVSGGLGNFNPLDELEELAARCPHEDDIARMLYLDLHTYLGEGILSKVDRASMASGLEVRTPFLDHEFVEYVWKLPMRLRLSGLTTKYILKEAARGTLPDAIIDRPKKGFGIPVGKWFLREMRPTLEKFLSPDRIAGEGIFRPGAVRRLVDDHLARRRDCRKELWTLLNFEMWMEKYRPRVVL